jgi:hypothetical protein
MLANRRYNVVILAQAFTPVTAERDFIISKMPHWVFPVARNNLDDYWQYSGYDTRWIKCGWRLHGGHSAAPVELVSLAAVLREVGT